MTAFCQILGNIQQVGFEERDFETSENSKIINTLLLRQHQSLSVLLFFTVVIVMVL